MPQRVVDVFEPVEVDHGHRERAAAARGRLEHVVQLRAQSEPILQSGEPIVIGEEGDALFGYFAGRDIRDISVPDGAAVLVPARHRLAAHPGNGAVLTDDTVLEFPGLEGLGRQLHQGLHPLTVLRVGHGEQHLVVVLDFLWSETVNRAHPGTHIQELALTFRRQAPLKDHARNVRGDHGKPLADQAALLIGELVIGHVELHAENA